MTFNPDQLGLDWTGQDLDFSKILPHVGTFITKFYWGSLQTHENYHVEPASKLHPGS